MQISFALFTQMAKRMPDAECPRGGHGGPDDTTDPDFGDRGRGGNGGPDDTTDPDFGGRGGGDYYDGPDGRYEYDPYH